MASILAVFPDAGRKRREQKRFQLSVDQLMFKCRKRLDDRWTVHDTKTGTSVLPPRLEEAGLDHAGATLLATLLNTFGETGRRSGRDIILPRAFDA